MLIVPLSGLLAAEAVVAVLLCVPVHLLTKLALLITGLFRQQAVQIILMTAAAMLLVVLFFSVARMSQLRDGMIRPSATSGAASVFHEARLELYSEGIQSCLIVSSLLLGMAVVRLDELLRRSRSLQTSLDVVMKQAKGTQQAYMRQLEEKSDSAKGSESGASAPPEELAALRRENGSLKSEKEKLHRDLRSADASEAALKKQTEGLQLEFNRLLEENESLRSQLSLFDRKYSAGDDKKRS